MPSIVALCNLALSHVGNSVEIQNLDTENTSEANACRRFFEQTRDEVLRDFPWPFARTYATLALVETDPTVEWGYSYRYPTDCLMFGRILGPAGRNETRTTRVPYQLVNDSGTPLVYTDMVDAVAEYQVRVEDPTFWAPDFSQAVAAKLGYYIAPRVTGGDPTKLGDRAKALYLELIERAKDNALNEEQPDELPDSEFISMRDS